jgi:putative endonuclease
MMAAFVYIVECADRSYYTGWTTDIAARVASHNSRIGARYTRSRTPVALVYWEQWPMKQLAQKREAAIKRMTRSQKELLVQNFAAENSTERQEYGVASCMVDQ